VLSLVCEQVVAIHRHGHAIVGDHCELVVSRLAGGRHKGRFQVERKELGQKAAVAVAERFRALGCEARQKVAWRYMN
jgi:hypothetical protein